MRTRLRIPRSWRAPSPCRLCRSSPCAPVRRGADVAAWAPRRASIGSPRCCTRASSLTRSSAIGPPPRSTGCRGPGGWTTASASSPSPMQATGTRRRSPAAAPATRSTATRAGPVTRRGRAAQETRPSVLRGSSGAHYFSARHGVAAPEPAQPRLRRRRRPPARASARPCCGRAGPATGETVRLGAGERSVGVRGNRLPSLRAPATVESRPDPEVPDGPSSPPHHRWSAA